MDFHFLVSCHASENAPLSTGKMEEKEEKLMCVPSTTASKPNHLTSIVKMRSFIQRYNFVTLSGCFSYSTGLISEIATI